jgi:hypothetical protein
MIETHRREGNGPRMSVRDARRVGGAMTRMGDGRLGGVRASQRRHGVARLVLGQRDGSPLLVVVASSLCGVTLKIGREMNGWARSRMVWVDSVFRD